MAPEKDPLPLIPKQRLLFVDDEEGVRLTLPTILQNLDTLFRMPLRIGEYLQGLLEESIRAFQAAPTQAAQTANAQGG